MREHVPLASLTTLGLGGPARFFAEVSTETELMDAVRWAASCGFPIHPLGGGSNVVISDDGLAGLVLRIGLRGVAVDEGPTRARVRAAAGEPWDALVERAVVGGFAGLECLSGIPGLVGATPIQNVGAYGQEVSEVITSVRALDRRSLTICELGGDACGFAYRDSMFRRAPGRYVVLSVTFDLRPGGPPTVRYPELARALGDLPRTLESVRNAVLDLRRAKSMVIEPDDPNRRSVGSFFTNPIVPTSVADRVVATAVERGIVTRPEEVPRFDAGPGRVKLAAGWLIERAGVTRGLRRGHVGISSGHALALVHHGGGTTAELLELATFVRDRVRTTWDVGLALEPVVLGEQAPTPTGQNEATRK